MFGEIRTSSAQTKSTPILAYCGKVIVNLDRLFHASACVMHIPKCLLARNPTAMSHTSATRSSRPVHLRAKNRIAHLNSVLPISMSDASSQPAELDKR